ncbi:M81 family metallopeptidase [Algihabitans albus]|uniref:M81 family metallopeptidase n=1 Tax=Algihabitans albus TaxID=2164067 RepID=UPI000E5CCB62|nr:M81 family metallopeptidase [Algihabitans albus]
MKIAIAGFQHETNTFAPAKADYDAFASGGAWPPLSRGAAMLQALSGMNLPAAGAIEEARSLGHQVEPLSWAAATPSDRVTRDAYERIASQIFEDLEAQRGLDGIYLDLHGAMVTEAHQDGEGELLRRLRDRVGPELPIVVSLDLHANVTPEMVDLSDGLVIYRTYPHVDMAETGARALRLLHRLMDAGPGRGPRYKAYRQLPFLIPLTSGCTLIEPADSLYGQIPELEGGGVATLSFACGFSPADIHHAGPSVVAYGESAEAAGQAADTLYESVAGQETAFAGRILPADQAVTYAVERSAKGDGPVVIADTQDNPGAGGNGDTVGLLAELVRQRVPDAVIGVLFDPANAKRAAEAGEGAELQLELGSHSGLPGHRPLSGTYRVKRVGDGVFTCTGPFYRGARMRLGPMALLEIGGVEVVVGCKKAQAADRDMFRHVGVEPEAKRILALKSSVHFRADFQPIASEVIVAAAPGPNPVDHLALTYGNLRPDIRLMPMGPTQAAHRG